MSVPVCLPTVCPSLTDEGSLLFLLSLPLSRALGLAEDRPCGWPPGMLRAECGICQGPLDPYAAPHARPWTARDRVLEAATSLGAVAAMSSAPKRGHGRLGRRTEGWDQRGGNSSEQSRGTIQGARPEPAEALGLLRARHVLSRS